MSPFVLLLEDPLLSGLQLRRWERRSYGTEWKTISAGIAALTELRLEMPA